MANKMCPRCAARGQTWSGEAPRCGFLGEAFCADNWNCATLNALRDLVEPHRQYGVDESLAVLYFQADTTDGFRFGDWDEITGWLVLSWYKNRGCTPVALVVDSGGFRELTLPVAEAILRSFKL